MRIIFNDDKFIEELSEKIISENQKMLQDIEQRFIQIASAINGIQVRLSGKKNVASEST